MRARTHVFGWRVHVNQLWRPPGPPSELENVRLTRQTDSLCLLTRVLPLRAHVVRTCRRLHPSVAADVKHKRALIKGRLDLHANDKTSGDLLALSPVGQMEEGKPVACPPEHVECRAANRGVQHGKKIRDMLKGDLLVEIACLRRRGKALVEAASLTVDEMKGLVARHAYDDHEELKASTMLRVVLKRAERKKALPLLIDTKLSDVMALAIEFGVQQPERLLHDAQRPHAMHDLAHEMCKNYRPNPKQPRLYPERTAAAPFSSARLFPPLWHFFLEMLRRGFRNNGLPRRTGTTVTVTGKPSNDIVQHLGLRSGVRLIRLDGKEMRVESHSILGEGQAQVTFGGGFTTCTVPNPYVKMLLPYGRTRVTKQRIHISGALGQERLRPALRVAVVHYIFEFVGLLHFGLDPNRFFVSSRKAYVRFASQTPVASRGSVPGPCSPLELAQLRAVASSGRKTPEHAAAAVRAGKQRNKAMAVREASRRRVRIQGGEEGEPEPEGDAGEKGDGAPVPSIRLV